MSYVHVPHSRPLDNRRAFQLLQQHAKEQPQKEAIVFRDEKLNRTSITFQEYNTKSSLLAAGLLQVGLERGDRVVVLLRSRVQFVLFHMALNRIGANMVIVEDNAYPAVNGIAEAVCVVAQVQPTATNNGKLISEIRRGLHKNSFKAAVLVGSVADVESLDHPKAYNHQMILAMAENNPQSSEKVRRAESLVQMDDECMVILTSGTTSIPKPIQYSHHAYVNGACASIYASKTTEGSVFFSDMPFDWIPGVSFCLGAMIVQGFTLVMFPAKLALTENHSMTFMKIFEQESVTHALLLPYVLQDIMLCRVEVIHMKRDQFQVVITGGQPTPLGQLRKLFDIWPDLTVVVNYGATESAVIGWQKITKENVDSIDNGVLEVIPGVEIKAIGEDGQLVPIGEPGEICVRSAWVQFCNWELMIGEKGQPNPKNSNGWHCTKDQGMIINRNAMRLIGRMDFMIKCACESVPPSFIEETLQDHPSIERLCVVGVPDKRLYQKICACIILKKTCLDNLEDTLQDELDEWGKDRFWESSCGVILKPHYYVFLDSFPLTRSGKLSRQRLQEIAMEKIGLKR